MQFYETTQIPKQNNQGELVSNHDGDTYRDASIQSLKSHHLAITLPFKNPVATRIPALRAASTDSCTPSRSGSKEATMPHKVRPDLGCFIWFYTIQEKKEKRVVNTEHIKDDKIANTSWGSERYFATWYCDVHEFLTLPVLSPLIVLDNFASPLWLIYDSSFSATPSQHYCVTVIYPIIHTVLTICNHFASQLQAAKKQTSFRGNVRHPLFWLEELQSFKLLLHGNVLSKHTIQWLQWPKKRQILAWLAFTFRLFGNLPCIQYCI